MKLINATFLAGTSVNSKKKRRVKLFNEVLNKAPFTKKNTITVDRISGSLTEVRESYLVNGNALKKYTKEYEYTCEASDKTKF